MESVRKISRRYYLRQIVAIVLSCWMMFGMPVQIAMANPNPGDNIVPGSGNVIGNTVPLNWTGNGTLNPTIGTATGNNIITWNNMDIGADASLTFTQNGGWILNNVQAADAMATGINGGLNAQSCGLIVVNPLGVVFGPKALVQARNFIGSSREILDADFANGTLNFTGNSMGEVINDGRIIADHMVALIGKRVVNRGVLRATDSYAIMAAGEDVLISGNPAGRNITVHVADVAVPSAFEVRNEGELDADHVILAAGDIFSTAIEGVETLRAEAQGDIEFDGPISAFALPGSDAVADVTIITGGDFTASDNITATALAGDDSSARANITIDAGGDVTVKHGKEVRATAIVFNDGGGCFDTEHTGNARATVGIDAGGDVTVEKGGKVVANALVLNGASCGQGCGPTVETMPPFAGDTYSGNATAIVDIAADGDVEIQKGGDVLANALIFNGSLQMGGPGQYPGYGIDTFGPGFGGGDTYSGNARATVNIAGDDVTIQKDGTVMANAVILNGDIEFDIYNIGGPCTDTLSFDGPGFCCFGNTYTGNAVAKVGISAGGDVIVDEGGVVMANALLLNGGIGVEIYDDKGVLVDGGPDWFDGRGDTFSGDARATVDIAAKGDVHIASQTNDEDEGCGEDEPGTVMANALILNGDFDLEMGGDNFKIDGQGGPGFRGWGGDTYDATNATAKVAITAGGDVIIEEGSLVAANAAIMNGNIDLSFTSPFAMVMPGPGGPRFGGGSDSYSGNAVAGVDIAAGGDVIVAEGGTAMANALILNGDIDVDENYYLAVDGGWGPMPGAQSGDTYQGNARATVDIAAGGDVEVADGGMVAADAAIMNGDFDLQINRGSYAVIVKPQGQGGPGSSGGSSDSYTGNATAKVNIAGEDVIVEDGLVMANALILNGDVDVATGDMYPVFAVEDTGEQPIIEEPEVIQTGDSYAGNATAAVDIVAGGDVEVTDGGTVMANALILNGDIDVDTTTPMMGILSDDCGSGEIVEIDDSYAGNARATVNIDADGDVLVACGGSVMADALILNGDFGVETIWLRTAPVSQQGGNYGGGKTDTYTGNAVAKVAINGEDVIVETGGSVLANAAILNGDIDIDLYNGQYMPIDLGQYPAITSGHGGRSNDTYQGNATARVDITADGDVAVEKGGEVIANALIVNGDVDVDTGGVFLADVVADGCDGQKGDTYQGNATAVVTIDATDDVTVQKGGEVAANAAIINGDIDVDSGIHPFTDVSVEGQGGRVRRGDTYSGNARATVDIASAGDVTVKWGGEVIADAVIVNGDVQAYTGGMYDVDSGRGRRSSDTYTGNATAKVDIAACEGGEVIIGEGGEVASYATIINGDDSIYLDGIMDVEGQGHRRGDSFTGNATATTNISAEEGITVASDAEVIADAYIQNGSSDNFIGNDIGIDRGGRIGNSYDGDARANVNLETCGGVTVDGQVGAYAEIDRVRNHGGHGIDSPHGGNSYSGKAVAGVSIKSYEDVVINSGSSFEPDSLAVDGYGYGSGGRIEAIAEGGIEASRAKIDILTCNSLIVNNGDGCRGGGNEIYAKAEDGEKNTSVINIAARKDLIVNGQIKAKAKDGYENRAAIDIVTGRDVIVNGATIYEPVGDVVIEGGRGGHNEGGQIVAEAEDAEGYGSKNVATIDIFACRDVIVNGATYVPMELPSEGLQLDGGRRGGSGSGGLILAKAEDGFENRAKIDIVAQRDVIVNGGESAFNGLAVDGGPGGCDSGNGQIVAEAEDGFKNTANVSLLACDDVTIDGRVKAEAEDGCENRAKIEITAGDQIDGDGALYVKGHTKKGIVFRVENEAQINFEGWNVEPEVEILDDFVCPTCDYEWTWCEECEEDNPNPVPPLYTEAGEPLEKPEFAEGGCPVLMNWFASEVGVPADQINVILGNADYLATDIQPCEACARLKQQADAMAALNPDQVNAWASAVRSALVGPPTPEMIVGIRTALADNPAALDFDDAAAEYVRIMNEELGLSTDDALAVLTGNYAPDHADLASYISARTGM